VARQTLDETIALKESSMNKVRDDMKDLLKHRREGVESVEVF
jgi:hypothetical protein